MLREDIKIEQEVAAGYGPIARENEESDLREFLLRILDDRVCHAEELSDLMKKGAEWKGPD